MHKYNTLYFIILMVYCVRSTSIFSNFRDYMHGIKSSGTYKHCKHVSGNSLLLRGGGDELERDGQYDFYGKYSQQPGTGARFTAISRIPAWDSSEIIAKPQGHSSWLRITAHQKEVAALVVIQFEGNEYLISADNFGVMLVWDTSTWQCVRELAGHRSA
jgi:hypothetical protein